MPFYPLFKTKLVLRIIKAIVTKNITVNEPTFTKYYIEKSFVIC